MNYFIRRAFDRTTPTMEQRIPPSFLLRAMVITVGCVLTMAIGQFVAIALIGWLWFPDVLEIFTQSKLPEEVKNRVPDIPMTFWWCLIGFLAMLGWIVGAVAARLLPAAARSQIWLIAVLLFLIYFQQFLGQQEGLRWVNMVLSLMTPGMFVWGARIFSSAQTPNEAKPFA
ncbi:MAG: hypothetical protein KF851_08515 [Pirellulaceae bacterium]|nr:hypothetical protein [Pirellulaceae bacterium]